MARDIAVELVAKADKFQRDIKKAVGGATSELGLLQKAAGLTKSALAGLGAGLSVAGLAAFVKSGIDAADQMGKLASRAGVSVEAFTRFNYAANLADVGSEQLAGTLAKLGKNADAAARGSKSQADVFDRLGVSVTDAEGRLRNVDAIFLDVATSLSKLPDGATKTALAMGALGREGGRMIPLLNGGAKALREAGDEAERFGLVVDTQTAEAADRFGDELDKLKKRSEGLSIQMGADLLPHLNDIVQAFKDGYEQGGLFDSVLMGLGQTVTEMLGDPLDNQIEGTRDAIAKIKDDLKGLKGETFLGGTQKAVRDFFAADNMQAIDAATAALSRQEKKLRDLLQLKKDLERPRENGAAGVTPRNPTATPGAEASEASARAARKSAIDAILRDFKDYDAERRKLAEGTAEVEKYMTDQVRERAKLFDQAKEGTREEIRNLIAATRTPAEEYAAEVRRLLSLRDSGLDDDTFNRGVDRARKAYEDLRDGANEANDAAKELGLTFSSAAEEAIVNWQGAGDVLRGIADDLLRVLVRKGFTDPLAEIGSSLFKSAGGGEGIMSFIKGIFGGFRAGGGPVSAGKAYVVGERGPELFFPGQNGSVAANGAGGVAVVVNNYGSSQVATRNRGMVGGRRQVEVVVRDAIGGMIRGGSGAQIGLDAPLAAR